MAAFKYLFLTVSVVFWQLAFSHGGGLNSEGCHNEKKIGGYHCHRSSDNQYNRAKKSNLSSAYNRLDFKYRSYKPIEVIGYYRGITCPSMNIDHLVSLKDAFESGAHLWPAELKIQFANDRENHVPACSKINSSKGSTGPEGFLRRSNDDKGVDYKIVKFCEYVEQYYSIKIKYRLSFSRNNKKIFRNCNLEI
ncbi:YHYH domain-containing protein [Porticoccaceae bacterium]|nr:YHYH domain-containing protein [Porticoccaceae bacterium]